MSELTGAFAESLEKIALKGLERARDIVARIPADPGWRACIVLVGTKLDDERSELCMSLIPITHWGILRPVYSFGPFAGAGALFGALTGGGASAPVPMSAQGAVLDGEGFWGLAAPHETDAEIAAKFQAEIEKANVEEEERRAKRAARRAG